MSGQIRFYYKGSTINYMPEENVLILIPGKSKKDDFLDIKSRIDTLLRVSGTKRSGDSFSLKLDPNFTVDIPEVLKSIDGVKGGLEIEDAKSLSEDEAEENVEDQTGMNSGASPTPPVQNPAITPNQPPLQQNGPLPENFYLNVVDFLFEVDGLFQPGPTQKTHKKSKRYGEYWKPLESISGKNRNKLKPQDVIEIRKRYSLKPPSTDRDLVLRSLDKAANYFYSLLLRVKGEKFAEEFDSQYVSQDNLRPEDYDDENQEIASVSDDASIGSTASPDFSGVDYDEISIEN